MKFLKHILLLIILVVAEFVSAQEEFSFQLYFEDAIGQRDTITLGYDPLATDTIDTAFGEVNILNQPWSDNLDVRIGDMTYSYEYDFDYDFTWINPSTFYTKKQILNSYCDKGLDKSARISIHCNLKHLPITMKWERDTFLINDCIYTSSFYRGYYDLGPAHFDAPIPRVQLSTMGEELNVNWYLSENTSEPKLYLGSVHNPLHLIPTYLNNGDTIGVFQFVFWQRDTSTTSNDKISPELDFQLYPNPTNDFVTIDIENNENSELLIYQLDGTLIRKQTLMSNSNNISICDLNTGVYLFKIDSDKGMLTKKVIKN